MPALWAATGHNSHFSVQAEPEERPALCRGFGSSPGPSHTYKVPSTYLLNVMSAQNVQDFAETLSFTLQDTEEKTAT